MDTLITDLTELSKTRYRNWRRTVWWAELGAVVLYLAASVAAILGEALLGFGLIIGVGMSVVFVREEQWKAQIRNALEREHVRRQKPI